ncbi:MULTISPECIES: DUF1499 domain-containing protein [Alphaproteobacteria]|uniref:Membrane protein n=2 Tax=Alphaproteobacteria TaxID=28211 RepID=A0A512HFH5_9HYPH|nr:MULTISPECIES: DUF1499 domain-containing protein [Alphaproteobacteria]GEO84212.1 membrane protein [Ciceribacter naphthalenivorans]GLR24748.1 membrane protein [Ciceribacter naphthalenivorans]GLT07604.1 membrane protein [Sphingomonas psychrolutea]
MTIRYDRPVSRSAFLARRLGLLGAGMMVVVVLGHRFGPLTTPDFVALVAISAVPAALALPLALLGLARLWQIGALGGVAAAWALFYATLPLGLVGWATWRYLDRPPIYDVSSDLVDPPQWLRTPAARQQWMERPEISPASRHAQMLAYPGLTGHRYEGALDRVYEAVRKVVDESGLTVVAERGQEFAVPEFQPLTPARSEGGRTDPNAVPESVPVPQPRPEPQPVGPAAPPEPIGTVRLQAMTRTFALGLPFDVVIRLREEAETTLVDVRVASRYGPHDLGIGDEIAEHFMHTLDAELLGIAGD